MAIRRFDLSRASLDNLAVLVHGTYGVGKTHLLGDYLRWAKDRGPIAFLNLTGEDGYSSVAGMGLGEAGWDVENTADFDKVLGDIAATNPIALAVDSYVAYYEFHQRTMLGSIRFPDPKIDGERAKMLWGQLKQATRDGVLRSRRV